jgi:hypothetical protein
MTEGTVTLPPANETAPAAKPETTAPGAWAAPTQTEEAGAADANRGNGAEQSASDEAGVGNQPSSDHILQPRNGRFGAVVVGVSLEEEYPEMAQIWSGRVAYTVYLQIGLARSWILQYSLPRSAEAAAVGSVAPMEAPWPYDIERPRFDFGNFNTNALIVHAYVNKAGRFESLAIVYPPQFAQAEFVLYTLQRWKFRPAKQAGKMIAAEVVLVIPNDLE